MFKRMLFIILACCLSVFMLSACGRPAPAGGTATAVGKEAAAAQNGTSTGAGTRTGSRKDSGTATSDAGLPDESSGEVSSTPAMTAPKNAAKEISISVAAPDGWTNTADDSTLLHYENAQGTCFLDAVKPWMPSDAKTAMDIAKYQRQQIKDVFQEAQASEPANIAIDGIEAVRMDLEIPISEDLSQKQVYIYFLVDDVAYQVMGVYFTNDAQGKNDVESMIRSMKIE